MEKPEWCKCEGHEHEINIHSKECCFCGCKPPTKKIKFSEMFEEKLDEILRVSKYDQSDAYIKALAKTLEYFLPEIDVPDEEGEK